MKKLINTHEMRDAIEKAYQQSCEKTLSVPAQKQAHGGDDQNGPPDLDRLASALKDLDPDCDDEAWKLRGLAPLAQAARDNSELAEELKQLAIDWSSGKLRGTPSEKWSKPGNNGLTGEQIFEETWDRFSKGEYSGKPVTLGTIFHDAKAVGWTDPRASVDSQQDALAAIQNQFALLNLNGRLWIPDRSCLETKQGQPAGKLMLSNRSDGSLLIKRAVIAQFPDADAKKIVDEFFTSPETTCYRDVEFNPSGTTEDHLNLWVGPTAKPRAGNWKSIKYFLFKIICNGDKKAYRYLIRYLAHALQQPAEKPGVVIVMLGGQGTGKGTFGRILHKIWGATFLQVYNMDAVTGNFNGSLERAFIVFMDEALFAGDKRSANALKSLVTEEHILVNEKHQPARQIRSYHRYVAATNAEHWKHTELDDRRDFVLRVSEDRKGDHDYWRSLHQAIENGAVEAMMYDLLEMDLSGFNVREKPQTRALLDQKVQSLESVALWWYECLQAGAIGNKEEWPDFIGTLDSIDDVVELAGKRLYKKPTPSSFKKTMRELCPGAEDDQQNSTLTSRVRGLALPPLEQCREEFEAYIGSKIDWAE